MRRRCGAVAAAALALAVTASDARAQDDAADAAALDAARRLIDVSGIEGTLSPIVDVLVAQLTPLLRAQAPRLTDDQFADFQATFEEEMQALIPELLEYNARSYADAFTRDELEALIDFYQTPVGRKAIEKLPALTQQSMAAGAVLGR